MITALVVTVGGTPQPLVESIKTHRPQFVCFVCSQESVEIIGRIKESLRAAGFVEPFRDYKIIVDDVDDLVSCYRRAQEAVAKVKEWGVAAEEVLVDYTGGTKTMSVAVGLATVTNGFGFSYVGGRQRTKEGLGIVVDGYEEVRTGVSPWSLFAIEERGRVTDFFNHYQFEAARRSVEDLLARQSLEARLAHELKIIHKLCVAYSSWDKFVHLEAYKVLQEAIGMLEEFLAISDGEKYERLLHTLRENSAWLRRMQSESEGFRKPTFLQVADLIANAERRSTEGKFDDAVARLYRALEMVGQIALAESPLNIKSPDDVPVDRIPAPIRDEYRTRYTSEADGKIKLPLQATFRLLKEAAHPLGLKFFDHKEELRGLLAARNSSILAHGLQPVKDKTYQKLKETLANWLGEANAVELPQLPH